jgi:two-component system, NtrC family, response regulator HydG
MSGIGSQIIGKSKQTDQLRKLIVRLAASTKNVAIIGESGSGKTTIAALLGAARGFTTIFLSHQQSESELNVALSSITNESVLFENIEKAGFQIQEIVCRFMGAKGKNVRIIATLSATPDQLLQERTIIDGLAASLKQFESIAIRPLREHPEDILLLVRHFGGGLTIDINTIDALVNHPWPGNISQLRSIVERCVSAVSDNKFELPPEFVDERTELARTVGGLMGSDKVVLDKSLDAMEGTIIRRALERFGFNESLAAQFLGMSDQVFVQKLRRLITIPQR